MRQLKKPEREEESKKKHWGIQCSHEVHPANYPGGVALPDLRNLAGHNPAVVTTYKTSTQQPAAVTVRSRKAQGGGWRPGERRPPKPPSVMLSGGAGFWQR